MTGNPYLKAWYALLIGGMVLLVFWPLQYADFINYDDNLYVFENTRLSQGFSWENIKWALIDYHTGYWHPLTWLTFFLDYQLYGPDAGGYHWTSVLFHLAASLLLFKVMVRMTGAPGKSFLVSAFFAVHPLHVESVAWISERKDVLSGFLFMLTLWLYIRYADKRKFSNYLLVLLSFVLGSAAKPILVTLPFVLLLLDYWPLGRIGEKTDSSGRPIGTWENMILEKAPFFALSAALSIMTFWTARQMGGVISLQKVPFLHRLGNAILAYGGYLRKMFFPADLSVFYPYPATIPLASALMWLLVLAAITGVALLYFKKHPYLTVGWLWYLGMLFPVIGLVQAGEQGMADRYTYLSLIGIFIALAWWLPTLLPDRRLWRRSMAVVTLAVVAGAMIISSQQVRYWQNSTTLFQHALKVTKENSMAHNTLGLSLFKEGQMEEALHHYREAIRIRPNYANAHNNIGLVLMKIGETELAIDHYGKALRIIPNYPAAHINMGIAMAKKGDTEAAISHFQAALAIQPRHALAHNNMGIAMAKKGDVEAAIRHFRLSLESDPNDADTHNNLAIALANSGRPRDAVRHFYDSLSINPRDPSVHNNLGLCLANGGYYEAAMKHFREALKIDPAFAIARKNLDAVSKLVTTGKNRVGSTHRK